MERTNANPFRDFWEVRADQLVQSVQHVLTWARDADALPSRQPGLQVDLSLHGIAMIAMERRLALLPPDAGPPADLTSAPDALILPLLRYLGETGGYDLELPCDRQRTDEPARQHSYVLSSARGQVPMGLP